MDDPRLDGSDGPLDDGDRPRERGVRQGQDGASGPATAEGPGAPAEPAAPLATGAAPPHGEGSPPRLVAPDLGCTAYRSHGDPQQVTLRSPAELADALPYILGYRPEDSIVLVALHEKDGQGRFGGRARLGIPADRDDWPSAARQLTRGLVLGSTRRGTPPEQMILFLCREPERGVSGREVKEHLAPLAHALRVECGALDVPVVEALCVSDGRYWSYCCDIQECCPAEGTPMGLAGTSVVAAAATYAGLQVRGTLRELRARLQPREGFATVDQEAALDAAGLKLVPRILDEAGRVAVADETLRLAERVRRRFAAAPPVSGALPSDLRDDELIRHDEAATLILGLQDRTTRDRAAEWMEGEEAVPALRLWRALARRCSGPYGEHAAAPLTLAGWVAWSTGDELEAREAFAMALGADPDYLFARLLHQACNEGLDPESVRRCLRSERSVRAGDRGGDGEAGGDSEGGGHGGSVGSRGPTLPGATGAPDRAVRGADGATAAEAAPLGAGDAASRRRSHGREPEPGGSPARRRTRADGRRPSARIPRQRAWAGTTHPGSGARGGPRPGSASVGGTRPTGPRPGTPGRGASRHPGGAAGTGTGEAGPQHAPGRPGHGDDGGETER
ncbi:DUF4192 domain-containing protein [Streptomyces sp. NPDC029526]|uniref:DUF4192 domain-containing protein n=1 Tax=Streptomyces sp. NPDC029526 TaxID=3155728 RepID=UPI0034113640